MGRITTHVLDTMRGQPAVGVRLTLYRRSGEEQPVIASVMTNGDGRLDEPLVEGNALTVGEYELVFAIGEYFRAEGVESPDQPFFHEAVVRFTIDDPADDYHIPLLASPFSWTTYRGS